MSLDHYIQYAVEIRRRIKQFKPDALILGLGPSGLLFPHVQFALPKRHCEIFGVNDAGRACKKIDQLLVLDAPVWLLHPSTYKFQHIVESRADLLWIGERFVQDWLPHLPHRTMGVDLDSLPFHQVAMVAGKPVMEEPDVEADPVQLLAASPTAATSLAWLQGFTRIGVLGVDLIVNHHHLHTMAPMIDRWFTGLAMRAKERGGAIVNLSPIANLPLFEKFSGWSTPKNASASST